MIRSPRLLAALLCAACATCALHAADDVIKLPKDQIPKVKFDLKPVDGQTPLRVKVLVLDFNPLIPGSVYAPDDPTAEPKGLREVGGWNDSIPLAQGFMDDMYKASGGYLQYEVAEWNVVRRFQKKVDGYVYTPEVYIEALKHGTRQADAWHQPDGVDYEHMVKEFNIVPRVESGEIDEVWMMGIPYFGYYESCMIGKNAFYINGGVFDRVPCERRFAVMGFNCERGVAEMIHDVCHRTEATMSRAYGGWDVDKLTTNWARFAANEKQSGTAAVGTCHYPPNAEHDYDYANKRFVDSTARDWLHYPDLTGRSDSVNCDTWAKPYETRPGQPDYHRNFQCWWFTHLPKAGGVNDDGHLNNWWEYVYNFNAYDDAGKPLKGAKPVADPEAEKEGYHRPA